MSKILMMARLYYPHVGGVEKHVYNLAIQLIKRGDTVSVITEDYAGNLKPEDNHEGIRVVRIGHELLRKKLDVWKWIIDHKDLFVEADIVHTHDVWWWYAPLLLLLPGKRIFTTFHGYEGSESPTWRAILHRKVAELSSAGTICVGAFMKQWYHANPTLVIYGAADTARVNRLGTGAVFVGRLSKDTGVTIYAEALPLLKKVHKLNVYGDGPQRKALNRPGIILHGWSHKTDLYSPFRYAFVSRYLAILEAMQARRLVVAVYDNAIKRDYLLCHPQAANMIIAGSPTELAEKLNALSATKEKEMIYRAYVWASRQTWTKLTQDYLRLWKHHD